jgi:hypothetical protein
VREDGRSRTDRVTPVRNQVKDSPSRPDAVLCVLWKEEADSTRRGW